MIVNRWISLYAVMTLILLWSSNAIGQDSIYIFRFPSSSEIEINVAASAEAQQNVYRYQYIVSSSDSSEQSTWVLEVQGSSLVDSVFSPAGWRGDSYGIRSLVSWGARDSAHQIVPGGNLGGFGFTSTGLPAIQTYYAEGWVPVPVLEREPDSLENDDILADMRSGRTLGARTSPSPFIALDFLDTLISMAQEALSLGWIEETYGEKIMNDLNDAREKMEESPEDAKEILEALIPYIIDDGCDWVPPDPSQYHLTSEGCALLRYNVEYLIEQIE